MPLEHTMILAFPYHDPNGRCNSTFRRQLATLQSFFHSVCIGATPRTVSDNADFIYELEAQGCSLYKNGPESSIGDHSRTALQLAVEQSRGRQPIFFGFLDRFLFALETEHRISFLQDLDRHRTAQCMAFERSPAAWSTHPANYAEVERMLSRMGELLYGSYMELSPCAFVLSPATASLLLHASVASSWAVWAEWLLLVAKNQIPITVKRVDWLAWEDPYWEQTDAHTLRRAQETNHQEVVKRMQLNAPIALLMTEPRFRNLTIDRHLIT
jgi:hypothetical protein